MLAVLKGFRIAANLAAASCVRRRLEVCKIHSEVTL